MSSEDQHPRKIKSKPEKSTAEKAIPTSEHSFTDYMQLYSSAQWLRFPRQIEAEFIADYYKLTIKSSRWAFMAGF